MAQSPQKQFPFGFPPSLACEAVGMNPNTYRSLRRDSILTLDQDAYRNEDLRAHSVLSHDDLVRMAVLQRMIGAGLNLKRYGTVAANAAARASYDLRAMTSTKSWLVVLQVEGEGPAERGAVIGPFDDAEFATKLLKAGGVGFALHVDLIEWQVRQELIRLGAMKVDPRDGRARRA